MVRGDNHREIDEEEEEGVFEFEREEEDEDEEERVDKGKSTQKKQIPELSDDDDEERIDKGKSSQGKQIPELSDDEEERVLDLEVDEEIRRKREDENFRRNIREELSQLLTDVDESKIQLSQPGAKELLDKIKMCDKLLSKIVHTREAAKEAGIFATITKISLAQVNNIHEAQQFDAKTIITNIINKYKKKGGNRQEEAETENNETVDIDWLRLGTAVIHRFNTVPTVTFMNGPLQKIEIKQIQRKPRKDTEDEEDNVTKVVEIETQTREDETSLQVIGVFKKLKTLQEQTKEKKPGFIDLTINPDSFTKSIENLFHFSFLVKDGKAGLSLDENEPKAFIANGKSDTDKAAGRQCVLKLDLDTWKKLARKVAPNSESLNGRQSPPNKSGKRPYPDTQDEQSNPKRRRK